MLVLSMDLSTSTCGVALLRDEDVLAEESWEHTRNRNQQLFDCLRKLLPPGATDAGVRNIDGFTVGLGPGAFSGLRMSLVAAQSLALPDHKPVLGISSSKALAWDIIDEQNVDSVTIVGDARRDRLWVASYSRTGDWLDAPDAFVLTALADLPAHIPPASLVASPDWDRIGRRLKERLSDRGRLLEKKVGPRARTVGRLLLPKVRASLDSSRPAPDSAAPLTPIYLHPPVSEKPVDRTIPQ